MKIIDSNKDYYDFYQDIYRDNTVAFDRRKSFILSREKFAAGFKYETRRYVYSLEKSKERDVILHIGYNFWLLKLTILEWDEYGTCINYDLEVVDHWSDYDCAPALIALFAPRFSLYGNNKTVDNIKAAIKHNDYKIMIDFSTSYIGKSQGISTYWDERTIPILQYVGIPKIINPLLIYLAIEEYLIKTSTPEVTESKGLTNDDKITNHGFSLKTSFRGK